MGKTMPVPTAQCRAQIVFEGNTWTWWDRLAVVFLAHWVLSKTVLGKHFVYRV
jgi:hypothetical protein